MKRDKHRVTGRATWVVGASSGIGAALAHELAERGALVAVSARRVEKLAEVAGDRMAVVAADVTDPDRLAAAANEVRDRLGGLHTVVYCAGFWEQTDATHWDREVIARHIEVNLLGMNNCIAAVLPSLLAAHEGHFVGIASVAGYRGLAGAEGYGPSKAAQINMLEAMRAGLAGTGVSVVTVCPGFVRTELTEDNTFPMPFLIEPDEAANAICDGLERGQHEIVFPLPMAAMMKTARLLPVRAWSRLSGRMADRT